MDIWTTVFTHILIATAGRTSGASCVVIQQFVDRTPHTAPAVAAVATRPDPSDVAAAAAKWCRLSMFPIPGTLGPAKLVQKFAR